MNNSLVYDNSIYNLHVLGKASIEHAYFLRHARKVLPPPPPPPYSKNRFLRTTKKIYKSSILVAESGLTPTPM